MTTYLDLPQQSGWILPDGRWFPTEDWWHIAGIYELLETGEPHLQLPSLLESLKQGDEQAIREELSFAGFVKVSRLNLDFATLTNSQLTTFQFILAHFPIMETIVHLIHYEDRKSIKAAFLPAWRVLKLKESSALWPLAILYAQ